MECQLSFHYHLDSEENWNRMKKSAAENDVVASTSKGTKNPKISKVAKSTVALKNTKAPPKRGSKQTGARSSKKSDR